MKLDWMSDLIMILAAEKDVVASVTNDAIMDSFANLASIMQRQLLFV